MKLRSLPHVAISTAFLSLSTLLSAQFNKVEEVVTFASRLNSPIEVDAKQNFDKISFTVRNRSFFPYQLEIKFSRLENLSPRIYDKKVIVPPGNSTLLTLNLINNEVSPEYAYSIMYSIGNPEEKPDLSNLYLIPLAKGEAVEFAFVESNNVKTFYRNQFVLEKGDPVFFARRGMVTSVSANNIDADRILTTSSIEIRHSDGTVAAYTGVVVDQTSIKPGQIVFPGQKIGSAAGSIPVELTLFAFKGDGRIESLSFSYALIDGQPLTAESINGKEVSWPESIITKELTKKEMSQYKKGELYKK
jgi:hypothetical protein